MPAFSIIMPVYNVEDYIVKTMESIIAQTYKDFELIVVNDGTTDNSMVMVEKFALNDSRIKIINQENKGISAARNRGLKAAAGEYVCFIDSDDEVDKDLLKIVMEKIHDTEMDVLMYGFILEAVEHNEEITASRLMNMPAALYSRETLNQFRVSQESLSLLGYVWNKVYKRSFLEKNQLYFDENKTFLEDIDFNEKVFKSIEKFMTIADCLYYYKRRKRVSLINTFRKDDFVFQMNAVNSRKAIMENWLIDKSTIESEVAILHVDAIRSSCSNLFMNDNKLTFKEKCDYIIEMLEDPLTESHISNFHASSIPEIVLKLIIKKRNNYALAIISGIYSVQSRLFNQ